MIHYISAFIFYTFAMIGVILIGFVIYKKTLAITKNENRGLIKVLDCLSIAPKKTLLVIKVKDEKFLIASGAEHTTFLAKLEFEDNSKIQQIYSNMQQNSYGDIDYMPRQTKSNIGFDNQKQEKLNKIQEQFKELYKKDETPKREIQQTSERKAMVRKLLKDLDETTTKQTGRF